MYAIPLHDFNAHRWLLVGACDSQITRKQKKAFFSLNLYVNVYCLMGIGLGSKQYTI